MFILSCTFANSKYKVYASLDRALILNQRAKECWCILIPMTGTEQSFSHFYWGTGRDWVWKQPLKMSFSLCCDVPGSLHPDRWECSLCREDSPRQSVSEGPRNPGGHSEYSGSWAGGAQQKMSTNPLEDYSCWNNGWLKWFTEGNLSLCNLSFV